VQTRLKEPGSKEEKFEDAAKETESAIALVLVY
jgi:hypothetical protein